MKDFETVGVELVAISADPQEDSKKFIAEKGITAPLLSDVSLKVASAYGVAMKGRDIAVPSTFILRQNGTIAWRHVGESMADRPSNPALLRYAAKLRDVSAPKE